MNPAPFRASGIRFKRWRLRLLGALLVPIAGYLGLQLHPQILFPHRITAEGITIYARVPLNAAITAQRAGAIRFLLDGSQLAIRGRAERIFLCNDPVLYRLLCPTGSGSFACSVPGTDHVFMNRVDLDQNVALRPGSGFNSRSFTGAAAHEIAHGLIRHQLGLLGARRLPIWVKEGYCDYVAREGSYPELEGVRRMASGKQDSSGAYLYFTYRQMVRHLIEDQGISFSQLIARGGEFEAVRAETEASLKASLPRTDRG